MEKKENLFIKVQLEKEQHTGELILNIYFDKNAPNFFFTNDTISWYPTIDEIDFINETSSLISKKTQPITQPPIHSPPPTRQTPTTPTPESPELISFEEKPIQTPITTDSPFDTHCEETPTKPPFINDAPPEERLASTPYKSSDTPVSAEEKLVQADEKSFTKALLEKLKKDNY